MQNLPKGIYILKFMDKEGIQNNLKITRQNIWKLNHEKEAVSK